MRRHLSDSMDEMKARTSGDTGSSQAQGATSTKTSEQGVGLTWSRRKGQTRGSGPKEQGQHIIQEDQKSQWSLALRTWQGPVWLKEAFEKHPPTPLYFKMYENVFTGFFQPPFLSFFMFFNLCSFFIPWLFFFFSLPTEVGPCSLLEVNTAAGTWRLTHISLSEGENWDPERWNNIFKAMWIFSGRAKARSISSLFPASLPHQAHANQKQILRIL